MPSNYDKFKLTTARHEVIYQLIEDLSFDRTYVSDFPQAIILGGQPGSGKSGLLDTSYHQFKGDDVVRINGDELRQFHPAIKEILSFDESNMAAYTDPDVRVWTKRLFDRTIETHRNVIFEGTMRESGAISKSMEHLKNEGYFVTARVLAVHARQSVAGIYQRFESQKAESGHGRMAPLSVHNQAYEGVLNTIDFIERKNLADKIQVYNRAGEVIHESRLISGVWDNPGIRVAMEAHRAIPPTIEESRDYLEDWANILSRMEQRGADQVEVQSVREIAKPYISEIFPIISTQSNMISRLIDTQKARSIAGYTNDGLVTSDKIEINDHYLRIDKKNEPEPGL